MRPTTMLTNIWHQTEADLRAEFEEGLEVEVDLTLVDWDEDLDGPRPTEEQLRRKLRGAFERGLRSKVRAEVARRLK
jgi:hypothetical protein